EAIEPRRAGHLCILHDAEPAPVIGRDGKVAIAILHLCHPGTERDSIWMTRYTVGGSRVRERSPEFIAGGLSAFVFTGDSIVLGLGDSRAVALGVATRREETDFPVVGIERNQGHVTKRSGGRRVARIAAAKPNPDCVIPASCSRTQPDRHPGVRNTATAP